MRTLIDNMASVGEEAVVSFLFGQKLWRNAFTTDCFISPQSVRGIKIDSFRYKRRYDAVNDVVLMELYRLVLVCLTIALKGSVNMPVSDSCLLQTHNGDFNVRHITDGLRSGQSDIKNRQKLIASDH